jgi:class 3 adenylate cyclase
LPRLRFTSQRRRYPAEHKQVTVLFADVHSMDIAAAVGAERLREIMAEVDDRCAAVVQPRWPLHRWSRRKQTTDAEGPIAR